MAALIGTNSTQLSRPADSAAHRGANDGKSTASAAIPSPKQTVGIQDQYSQPVASSAASGNNTLGERKAQHSGGPWANLQADLASELRLDQVDLDVASQGPMKDIVDQGVAWYATKRVPHLQFSLIEPMDGEGPSAMMNKAFHRVAKGLAQGGYGFEGQAARDRANLDVGIEQALRTFLDRSVTDGMPASPTIDEAASRTLAAAQKRFGAESWQAQTVRKAWISVKLDDDPSLQANTELGVIRSSDLARWP